ncbi:MAG: hypothetical protein ACJA2S_000049 [Cyclobacteriaceae bacterium]
MKKLILISLSLVIHSGLQASSDDEDNKLISQAMTISEPVIERTSTTSKEKIALTESKETETIEVNTKVDSSYYSVNKFNFVFYLMYKLKYLDEDNSSIPQKPLELEKD